MRVFALADLHLSFAQPKPMDLFGPAWADHAARIERNWRETVGVEDLVLIAGDISWAMTLDQARPDLAFLDDLPGRKVLVRGNHDYWWKSRTQLRTAFPRLDFLQADAMRIGNLVVCGTRLWTHPAIAWGRYASGGGEVELDRMAPAAGARKPQPTPEDAKLWRREIERLKLALAAAQKLSVNDLPILCLVHFPPLGPDLAPTEATELLSAAGVSACVFGHVHNIDHAKLPGFDATVGGVRYVCVSGDYVGFWPVPLG